MTLANLKQSNYEKVLCLKNLGIYKKKFVLIFSLFKTVFFHFFSIYRMVNIMDIYISIRTVMKNIEMLKFVPDHLKTKKNV